LAYFFFCILLTDFGPTLFCSLISMWWAF
jgi:hypothetical protein